MNKQKLKKLIQETLNEISPELLMRAQKSAEKRNDSRGDRILKKINTSLSSKLPIKFQTTDDKKVHETNIRQIIKTTIGRRPGIPKGEFFQQVMGVEYEINITHGSYNYKILIGYAQHVARLIKTDKFSNIEFDRKSAIILTKLINKIYNTNHNAIDLPLM